jgi:hypothetical protein
MVPHAEECTNAVQPESGFCCEVRTAFCELSEPAGIQTKSKGSIMSCDACEQFRESGYTTFFRWRNANIEVRGCSTHLAEMFACLRAAVIECEYDAKLIKAAPKLLEACKEADALFAHGLGVMASTGEAVEQRIRYEYNLNEARRITGLITAAIESAEEK